MKILSAADEKAHYDATVKGGLITGAGTVAVGTAASFAAYRSGWKPYRTLTLPLRAFAVVSVSTFALILGADHASRKFELARMRGNQAEMAEAYEATNLERSVGLHADQADLSHLSTRDRSIEWAKENRWKLVFGGWTASMAGSFAYISTTPMTFPQKVVQARMVAQALTVCLLAASAGLSAIQTGASGGISDAERLERQREQGMYKWKSGSPHEVAEKEGRRKVDEA